MKSFLNYAFKIQKDKNQCQQTVLTCNSAPHALALNFSFN